MLSKIHRKKIHNWRFKRAVGFLASSTLLLGSLLGVSESRAQAPSEAETIKFIEQTSHEAARFRGTRPSGVEDMASNMINFPGQTIRSTYVREWFNPEERGFGGFIYRRQALLSDLAEVRLMENALVFNCRDNQECIEESRANLRGPVTSKHKTSSFSVGFRQDTQEEQRRIVKALVHLAKLRGLNLVDGTVNRELFK